MVVLTTRGRRRRVHRLTGRGKSEHTHTQPLYSRFQRDKRLFPPGQRFFSPSVHNGEGCRPGMWISVCPTAPSYLPVLLPQTIAELSGHHVDGNNGPLCCCASLSAGPRRSCLQNNGLYAVRFPIQTHFIARTTQLSKQTSPSLYLDMKVK